MTAVTTTTVDISRVEAKTLQVGDVIGTTRSNTRAAIEAAIAVGGAQDRGADGYSRGNGVATIAKIDRPNGADGRVQARDGAGKMIRSMEPTTEVWRARAVEAGETPEPAKDKPARKAADKPAAPEFAWPTDPAKLLVEYLKARVTGAADSPNRAQPFINANGVLRMHSTDWIAWLAEQGIEPGKGKAAEPLRDAGLGVRTFPLPGEDRALGFYTGPAPKGTEKLPRYAPARAARAPRNPFAALSEPQRSELAQAMVERPEGELRDELLALLVAAGK
jgi:hypothetical protein